MIKFHGLKDKKTSPEAKSTYPWTYPESVRKIIRKKMTYLEMETPRNLFSLKRSIKN